MNLHINLHSQLASKDLDGSEQFSLGGADGIRAYPQGEASGSSGYQATAELRYATSIANLLLLFFRTVYRLKTILDRFYRFLRFDKLRH